MTIQITITPTTAGTKGQRYEARLDGKVVAASRTPFISAARALIERGHSPDTILTMTHEGSDIVALRGTLGAAAKLTVIETGTVGPRFGPYRPRPAEMSIAVVREGAGTADQGGSGRVDPLGSRNALSAQTGCFTLSTHSFSSAAVLP